MLFLGKIKTIGIVKWLPGSSGVVYNKLEICYSFRELNLKIFKIRLMRDLCKHRTYAASF